MDRNYAPYIQSLKVVQAPLNPDSHPSTAFTRLGCYLFGGILEAPKPRFTKIDKLNFISKAEDQRLRDVFYGDVLGVKPTRLCTCSYTEISEARFIKHVKAWETTCYILIDKHLPSSHQMTRKLILRMRHIPPQLLLPNKWFRSRDNLKVGDFVINYSSTWNERWNST